MLDVGCWTLDVRSRLLHVINLLPHMRRAAIRVCGDADETTNLRLDDHAATVCKPRARRRGISRARERSAGVLADHWSLSCTLESGMGIQRPARATAEMARSGWNGRPARWPTRPASGASAAERQPRRAIHRAGSLREMLPAGRRQRRAGRPFHPRRTRFHIRDPAPCQSAGQFLGLRLRGRRTLAEYFAILFATLPTWPPICFTACPPAPCPKNKPSPAPTADRCWT